MPAPVFIEMESFRPDGGAFGPDLALATNVLPLHGGWQPLRQKQIVCELAGTGGPMRGAYVHVYQQTVNVQEAGPAVDGQSAGWAASGGSGTDLFNKLNEVFPSDAEFILAGGAPNQTAPGQSAILNLPALLDPASGSDHLFRWRYRIPSSTGAWSLQLELVDEPQSITSITRSGTTATVTTGTHGLATGQVVYVSGANEAAYNGRFTITVTSATEFTYTVSGSPATPATGTITRRSVWKSDTASGTGSSGTSFVQREAALTAGEANAIVAAGYARFRFMLTAVVAGAVQFGRPVEDISTGGWLTQAGSSVNLYLVLDETSPSDADYIKSPALSLGGAVATYAAFLTDSLEDPLTDTGFTFRYRLRGSNAGVQAVVRLKQGDAIIKASTHALTTSFATQTISLLAAEWALVTDIEDLRLEVEASYPSSATSTVFQESAPESDLGNIGWGPSTGSDIYPMLDEASPSDADYITANSTLSNIWEGELQAVTDPGTNAGHSLKVRAAAPGSESLIVRLKSSGAVVRAWDFGAGVPGLGPLTTTLTTYTLNLTTGEASLLNYGALTVELTAYGLNGGLNTSVSWVRWFVPQLRWCEASWAELETPSPARAEASWMRLYLPGVAQTYRGDVPTILAGSKTALYEVTTAEFTDISDAAGYGAGAAPGFWRFTSMGNDPIATNRADPVQYRPANTGDFADLITSTLKPKARFAAVVRNHLVLADINLVGHFPDEVWWSYFDNARDFDNAPQGQGGFGRVVSRPGQIMGLVGGDYGVVFKRNSMHLMGWQGGGIPFRFDDISGSTGTPLPSSIVQTPYGIFFFDGATFRRYIGGLGEETLVDIGSGVLTQFITDTFLNYGILQFQPLEIYEEDAIMTGWWDPYARLVFWTYQHERIDGMISRHTHGVVYNPQEDRWGFLLLDTEVAGRGIPGVPVLFSSCWASMPNVTNEQTHALKGSVGFAYDGDNSLGIASMFRFDGGRTYLASLTSKRRALGIEGGPEEERAPVAVRLTGLMPIFTHLPADSEVPAISATATMSNDPFFVDETQSKNATWEQANSQGVIPCDISGNWLQVTANLPELDAQVARNFRGFYAFWDKAGTPSSR